MTVGYVGKSGGGSDVLDFSAVAGDSSCTNALLDVRDGYLTILADFANKDTVKTLNLRVDAALNVTEEK